MRGPAGSELMTPSALAPGSRHPTWASSSPPSSSPSTASTRPPGGPEEDTRGGFAHGGWSFVYGDDDFGRFVVEVFDRSGAYLLGRRTYDIFAGYWPNMTDPDDPIAAKLNALPKYVASSTLTDPDWA